MDCSCYKKDEWEEIKDSVNAEEPKFKVGDKIKSTRNEKILYLIMGTRLNELGKLDYVCKDISGGEFDGRTRNLTAEKVDEWAELTTEEEIPHEPKFKKGDWIVGSDSGYVYHIVGIKNGEYTIMDENGVYLLNFQDVVESKCRFWTIEDVKDGDVLHYRGETFILNDYVLFNTITYHCCYDGKKLIPHDIYSFTKDDFDKIHPATKAQRDILESKMREAGYMWDSEKKELRKIEKPDTIKFTDDRKLIEFENAVVEAYDLMSTCIPHLTPYTHHVKEAATKLLSLARKQIVSEIDPDDIFNKFHSYVTAEDPQSYIRGIKDVLAKIKEG